MRAVAALLVFAAAVCSSPVAFAQHASQSQVPAPPPAQAPSHAKKLAAAEALVAGSAAPVERGPEDPDKIRLTGKGQYKGRTYYLGASTRDGANPNPQLPSATDVTPCHPESVQYGSQKICAS